MNARQEKFCLEYAASGNIYQSAIKAGYSEAYARGNAAKLMENVSIKRRLQEIAEKLESEKIAQASEMQSILTSIIRQQLKEEVVAMEGCGDGISQATIVKKNASLRDVINAVDKLARMQGLYDDGMNLTITVPIFGGESEIED
jgi:phage terminase small subunit